MYIFLWLMCAVITAIIASNKGRSGFAWFFVGILTGALGVILALAVSKREDIIDTRAVSTGEFRKCPLCAEVIKSEALRCKHCGADVSASVPTAPELGPTLNVSIPQQQDHDYTPSIIVGALLVSFLAWALFA